MLALRGLNVVRTNSGRHTMSPKRHATAGQRHALANRYGRRHSRSQHGNRESEISGRRGSMYEMACGQHAIPRELCGTRHTRACVCTVRCRDGRQPEPHQNHTLPRCCIVQRDRTAFEVHAEMVARKTRRSACTHDIQPSCHIPIKIT